jgi:hypothetical protein
MSASRRRFDLTLALLLGIGFMAFCLWWGLRNLLYALLSEKVTAALVHGEVFVPVLTARIAGFAAALVALHLLLGLAAFACARLTGAALPRFAANLKGWLVFAWFVLIVLLAMLANAAYFPASLFTPKDGWMRADWNGLRPLDLVVAGIAVTLALLGWLAIRAKGIPARHLTAWSASVMLLAAGLLVGQGLPDDSQAATANAAPNIVILGIDSLRDEYAGAADGPRLTPNIDRFLAGAHRFSDTTSPLARTYPALVSMLTGRHPVTSNARFNLMPRSLVREGDTLADALSARGYRSVFAIDEVRFANFDQSFGFDQLITPPVGASDFLIGRMGDLPLVNLVSGLRFAGWLFPSNHANRAAAVTYRPGQFIDRVERELRIDRPTFLFAHLTLSHYPYSWADHVMPTRPEQYRTSYKRAISEVDRQFAALWRVLERKGLFDNAIVVVFSDHGEALGFPNDSMLRKTGTAHEIWNSIWGHGTSVMSANQYEVLLAMRAYGRAQLPGRPTVHDWPVTLEDLRPTLEEIATGAAPKDIDGISLLPYLDDPAAATVLDARIRYTETDFNTPMTLAGQYDESGLLKQGAMYYEIVPETGWMQLIPARLPELIRMKQRAAITRNALFASIPSWTDGSVTYLYSDRHAPHPLKIEQRPDPGTDPEAARLWDALRARFAAELPAQPGLP